jgi:adenylate cyclase
MDLELKRKFLVKALPDLANIIPISYERFFLYKGENSEIRIQSKNNEYSFERKTKIDNISHETKKIEITENEFLTLKMISNKSLIRDSFDLGEGISIKIYHGKFEGLRRAEVEFPTKIEATTFKPFDWMGKEITNTKLGKDSELINLTDVEFHLLINN